MKHIQPFPSTSMTKLITMTNWLRAKNIPSDKLCACCAITTSPCLTYNSRTEGQFYFSYFFLFTNVTDPWASAVKCQIVTLSCAARFQEHRRLNVNSRRLESCVLSATRRFHMTLIRADPSRGLSSGSALGNCILNAPVIPVCYPHPHCSCSRLSRIGSWNMTAP